MIVRIEGRPWGGPGMTAVAMFLRSHAIVHELGVGPAEGDFSVGHARFRGLSEEQLRARPQGWNSIAWLYWHMARTEDVAVNVMAARHAQVLDAGGWPARLRVARRDIGTGMSDDEVAALSAEVDLEALRAYRAAVGRQTQAVARELPPEAWEEPVGRETAAEALRQGAFAPEAEWVAAFWQERTRGWFLYWGAVLHNMLHLGQAGWVREMVTGRRGR
jgi:hypothetical protein